MIKFYKTFFASEEDISPRKEPLSSSSAHKSPLRASDVVNSVQVSERSNNEASFDTSLIKKTPQRSVVEDKDEKV